MAPVLATVLFSCFFLFNVALSRRVAIDQSDSSLVRFSGNWTTVSHPPALGGTYASTSEPTARVSIMLPWGTVAAHYIGFQLQASTTYTFCIDCVAGNDLINTTSIQVDGSFLNANERASPLLFFTLDNLDPTVPHVLTVFNAVPQNIITIDSVEIDVLTDTVTLPTGTSKSALAPLPMPSDSSPMRSSTSTPSLPPLAASTDRHASDTPTLPSPSATSQGSGSGGADKSVSVPLIISLTVASAIILVVVFIIHRRVWRPRRDDTVLESGSKSPRDDGPHGRSILFARDRSGSTESNVLPATTFWRTMSPNAGSRSLFGRFGAMKAARMSSRSRCVRTPSMMETLQSHVDSVGSIPNGGDDDGSLPPKYTV